MSSTWDASIQCERGLNPDWELEMNRTRSEDPDAEPRSSVGSLGVTFWETFLFVSSALPGKVFLSLGFLRLQRSSQDEI